MAVRSGSGTGWRSGGGAAWCADHPEQETELCPGVVPEDWRTANVVPLFGEGSRGGPGNYRPCPVQMSSHKKEHLRKEGPPQLAKREVPTQLKLRHAVPLSRDPQGIYSLALSLDGEELMVGFGNGAIQAVNPMDGKALRDIFSGGVSRQATTAMCFHPKENSHLIAVGAEGIVSVYNTKTGKCLANVTEESNQLYTMDISSDGSTFATAGSNRSIKIYDIRTNQVINVLEPADYVTSGKELKPIDGHTRRIFALRFHPEERHIFVSGGWDDSIKIWDKRMASEARKVINGPHICGPGIDIKNSKILTGSWVARNALQIWDFRKSSVEKNIPFPGDKDHGEFIYAARYCNSDIVVAGGSGTNSVHAINFKTDTDLGEIKLQKGPVHVVSTVMDGQQIAIAGAGGRLHIAYLV